MCVQVEYRASITIKVSHVNIVHSILTLEIRVRFQRDHFGAECIIGAERSIEWEFCSRKNN